MGIHDREYARREVARPGLPPVTKWLLILNLGIFVIDVFFLRGALSWDGAFRVSTAFGQGKIWQLITFQFLHASLGHVAFNCIGIYFFGPWVERWWGSRRFTAFYLLCGIAGALFYTLLWSLHVLPKAGAVTPLVGASAGIFGIIYCVYRIAPNVRVQLLFPPVEMSMRTFALVLGVFAIGTIAGGLVFPSVFRNEGGEAGHLGGALMGLLLMKFPRLLDWARPRAEKVARPKVVRRRGEPKLRPRTRVDLERSDEVDRILDKVSSEGFGSLTEEERKTLAEASKDKS